MLKDQLQETRLSEVPIYVGTGGQSSDYADIASSKAAREYHQEGIGILSEAELTALNKLQISNGSELQSHLEKSLNEALASRETLEIMMLAPPTDLIAVLDRHPELKAAIGHIHVMGGWVEVKNAQTGLMEKRSTYNVNMDAAAGAKLMKLQGVPITLYSSHIIKPNFAGGSVNMSNYSEIIEAIEKSEAHSLKTFRQAGLSWDSHLMEMIPPLKSVIGENAGRQFTPADPLVVIGLVNSNLITDAMMVNVDIDLNDLDRSRGYRVEVTENANSNVRLVTGLDTAVFKAEMLSALKVTETIASQNKNIKKKKANSCGKGYGG